MEIIQIDVNSPSKAKSELIDYSRHCSWKGTGHYFADLLENNEFDNSEKIFALTHNDDVIGFAGLVNESCIENSGLSPWLDFLFVDDKYRNHGFARMMIEHVLYTAKLNSLKTVYLCTASHEKMYEKFGFYTFQRTTINGNDFSVMKNDLPV